MVSLTSRTEVLGFVAFVPHQLTESPSLGPSEEKSVGKKRDKLYKSTVCSGI